MAARNYGNMATNLGKQNDLKTLLLSGATVYGFLWGGANGISDGNLDATVVIATVEATTLTTSTGYARQSVTMGASDATGVMTVPSYTWTVGSSTSDWPTNIRGHGLATASSAGLALHMWEHGRTCATTNTSTTVTVNGSGETTTGLVVGSSVYGLGIASSTTISSITDSTHFVISNAATATTNPVFLGISCDMSKPSSVYAAASVSLFLKNPWE